MLHVPVTGTGTEHIVQVINVFIFFPIDLDDRSSCIFPSILQMCPKCQKGYNTIQILNQAWCSHVMQQLQIIILNKLYSHVINIPPPPTDAHTHTGEGVGLYSGVPSVHNFTPLLLLNQWLVFNSAYREFFVIHCLVLLLFIFFYLNDL